jgi:tetratricopeptide (TPR) repeat protein
VDRVLIEAGVIYPPRGEVDLLRNALSPRALSDMEYAQAEGHPYNARRVPWMRAHRRADSPFFYADCDTASVLYLAIGEWLKLPISIVELPGHMFVRWKSETVTLNWDPNEGRVISDGEYFRRYNITAEVQRLFGYGECRSSAYLCSYWEWLVAQACSRRSDFRDAEKHFRRAVEICPENVTARNELAWFLATCPDDTVRRGSEAAVLAELLVKQARRPNWLGTLAAAYAETGRFGEAQQLIAESRDSIALNPTAVAANESVGDLKAAAEAYAMGLNYVQAVRAGKLRVSVSPAAINDIKMARSARD